MRSPQIPKIPIFRSLNPIGGDHAVGTKADQDSAGKPITDRAVAPPRQTTMRFPWAAFHGTDADPRRHAQLPNFLQATWGQLTEEKSVLNDQGEIIDAQIARLCVLYKDLRIEMTGVTKDIPQLDILDSAKDHPDRPEMVGIYRYFYFMRRSIATISEFAAALRQLNDSPSFGLVSSRFEEYCTETWASAIAFFDKKRLVTTWTSGFTSRARSLSPLS